MDFLFQTDIGSYYASLVFFGTLAIVGIFCLIKVGGIKYSTRYYFDRRYYLAIFLLGTLLFAFSAYKSFENIKDYNEISKGKIEEYYNIEKVGKTLVFELKKDNKILKNHFSSTIEEETDSDYIFVAKDQKVSISKSIVK